MNFHFDFLKDMILKKIIFAVLFIWILMPFSLFSQPQLPPEIPWSGKSESLVVPPGGQYATPIEKSNFQHTPSYAETKKWCENLAKASPLISVKTIGKTPEGYDIIMVVAARNYVPTHDKPTLLVQCGIHAGEIDGKDAGMMLLRDIVYRGKENLLNYVNLLFIPILNVDGHERSSPYNRINQRGPDEMGWRTNGLNQNLNRDYAKLDTKEIRAVVGVINRYHPDLYLDIHVTDGADYQYDITYGFIGQQGYSPEISHWLSTDFRPYVDSTLTVWGHLPGPLLFAANGKDFSDGNIDFAFEPDFSHSYGDLRHLPTVLVENHSLKPYKRRVLGTYIFIEAALKILANEHEELFTVIHNDSYNQMEKVPLKWAFPSTDSSKSYYFPYNINTKNLIPSDTMNFLGVKANLVKSDITGQDYLQWTNIPETQKIPVYRNSKVALSTARPTAYFIPHAWQDIIDRLAIHGVQMKELSDSLTVTVQRYKIQNYTIARNPFEGHYKIDAAFKMDTATLTYPPGTMEINTNQPLGDLAIVLLEPASQSSFFRWGFFNSILNRTEYVEDYIMEPYAEEMLKSSKSIRDEFEWTRTHHPDSLSSPEKTMNWFYEKSPYADKNYLIYPVTRLP